MQELYYREFAVHMIKDRPAVSVLYTFGRWYILCACTI